MSKPDRSLLDRLNALKPSSVSLGKKEDIGGGTSTQAPTTADVDGQSALSLAPAAPPTREDRLAARLKTLREVRDIDGGNDYDNDNNNNTSGKQLNEKPVASSQQPSRESETPPSECKTSEKPGTTAGEDAEDDPLFYVDDDAVNDLLLELAAEGSGLEDEDLGDYEDEADRLARGDGGNGDDDGLIPLPSVPTNLGDESSGDEGEDADNSKMVEDLLKSLAGTTINDDGAVSTKAKKDTSKDDSDDSDGETMEREVRRVLEQAQDEADLAKQRGDGETGDEDEEEDIVTSPRRRGTDLEDDILPGEKPSTKSKTEDTDNFLGLPTVPTKLVDPPPSPPSLPSLPSLSNELPSVPTQTLPKRGDDDDISARLAALRGLKGKAAGLGQTDAFGLPSAPTFRPGEEEGGVLKRGHYGHGRRNYTDADQKAWCVVCLEDATVRCLGCADNNNASEDEEEDQNNAYCNRCWRDMHVGPAAGFDERGHKRVPLVR